MNSHSLLRRCGRCTLQQQQQQCRASLLCRGDSSSASYHTDATPLSLHRRRMRPPPPWQNNDLTRLRTTAAPAHFPCRAYGTRVTVAHTDDTTANPALAPYVQSCLRRQRGETGTAAAGAAAEEPTDSGFVVSFLGTGGGGMPSQHRISSATALRLGGETFLFDAAEGVQRQVALSRLQALDFTKIFITHLHGDHLYGLPGLLLKMQTAARGSLSDVGRKSLSARPVLDIYGPVGLYNYVAMTTALSCVRSNFLSIVVHELEGGEEEGGPPRMGRQQQQQHGTASSKRQRGPKRSVFLDWYQEVSRPNLKRKRLPRNSDGTWTIESPDELTEDAVAANTTRGGGRRRVHGPDGATAASTATAGSKFHIRAGEVTHLPGVQTFGYVVEEPTPSRNIDVAKARALGVAPGPKYRLLKNGFAVTRDDDGTTTVRPEQVLLDGVVEPRKFALIGDNCAVPPEMAHLCQDVDVLVHEATVTEHNEKEAIIRGHATPEMAGILARDVNTKVLLLNHISAANNSSDAIQDIVSKAEEGNEGVSRVEATYDFMEFVVPRGGFDFRSS